MKLVVGLQSLGADLWQGKIRDYLVCLRIRSWACAYVCVCVCVSKTGAEGGGGDDAERGKGIGRKSEADGYPYGLGGAH